MELLVQAIRQNKNKVSMLKIHSQFQQSKIIDVEEEEEAAESLLSR